MKWPLLAIGAALVAFVLVDKAQGQEGAGAPEMGHVRVITIPAIPYPLACWRTSEVDAGVWRADCVLVPAIVLEACDDGKLCTRAPLHPIQCTENETKLDCTDGNSPATSPINLPGSGPYRPA